MAVFTPITHADLQQVAEACGISGALGFRGIADGIENSSYLIYPGDPEVCSAPRWVLTIIEELGNSELQFVCAHLQNLTAAGVPVASLLTSERAEEPWPRIAGKPALLFRFIEGKHITHAGPDHCLQLGRELARAHAVPCDQTQACAHGWEWLQMTATAVRPELNATDGNLLEAEIAEQSSWQTRFEGLPTAVIHADLFRDNVLFRGDQLSGLIDWYNACTGPMVYDIAIALNDWCRNQYDQLEPELTQAFLEGYSGIRTLSTAELTALPMAQRRAALRFWLSRLQAEKPPGPGSPPATLCKQKDPTEFARLLMWLRAQR